MRPPVVDPTTISGPELCELTGISTKALTRWCKAGVFGPEHAAHPGTGHRRRLTALDLLVARACLRVSESFGHRQVGHHPVSDRNGCPLPILVEIGERVRSGDRTVTVELAAHVTLTVDVADLHDGAVS